MIKDTYKPISSSIIYIKYPLKIPLSGTVHDESRIKKLKRHTGLSQREIVEQIITKGLRRKKILPYEKDIINRDEMRFKHMNNYLKEGYEIGLNTINISAFVMDEIKKWCENEEID